MKIAVVGAGVSGLVAARRLTQFGHDVSVFEASSRWGGHAQAITVDYGGHSHSIETGFLIFNESACPQLTNLCSELYLPTREVQMAYEIRNPGSELVVRGRSLRELLTVPKNLTVSSFYRFVPDWIRFMRLARKQLHVRPRVSDATIEDFLANNGFSDAFGRAFIYPLAGSAFPIEPSELPAMPFATLIGFIHNHGLLDLKPTASCRTLDGGSKEYLRRLVDSFRERIHLNCPVKSIARHSDFVTLKFKDKPRQRFEQVVIAVHADVAFRMLADPMRHEREVLNAFEYVPQNVYVHVEDIEATIPQTAATWRFQPAKDGRSGAALSYRIADVQNSTVPQQLLLTTADAKERPPNNLIRTIRFRRPAFTANSLLAQRRFKQMNSWRRTCYCGGYWGHGFHEDAVRSAEAVAQRIEAFAGQRQANSA